MLLHALAKRGGAGWAMLAADSWPWSSATFVGERHRIEVALAGDAAGSLMGIEEAEFRLGGHLVADIAVIAHADGRAVLEALTLVES